MTRTNRSFVGARGKEVETYMWGPAVHCNELLRIGAVIEERVNPNCSTVEEEQKRITRHINGRESDVLSRWWMKWRWWLDKISDEISTLAFDREVSQWDNDGLFSFVISPAGDQNHHEVLSLITWVDQQIQKWLRWRSLSTTVDPSMEVDRKHSCRHMLITIHIQPLRTDWPKSWLLSESASNGRLQDLNSNSGY